MMPTSSSSSPSSSNPLASSILSMESITSASSAMDNGTVATLQTMSTMSTFQSSQNSALLSEMEPNSKNYSTTHHVTTTTHLSSLGSNKSSSSSSSTSFSGNVQNVHGNIRSNASKPSRSSRYLRKTSLGKKSSFSFGSSGKKPSFSSSFASNATISNNAVNTGDKGNTGKSSFASNFSSNFNIQNLFSKINEGLNKADEEKQQQERLDYDLFVGEGEGVQGYNGLSIMANEGNEGNEQVAGFQIGTSGSYRDNDSKSVGAKKSFLNRIKPKRKNKLSLKALAKFKSFRNSNVEPEFEEGIDNRSPTLGMATAQDVDAALFESQLKPAFKKLESPHLDAVTPSPSPCPLYSAQSSHESLLPQGEAMILPNPFDPCCRSAAISSSQNIQTTLNYSSSSTLDQSQTSLGNSRNIGSDCSSFNSGSGSSSFKSCNNPYYNPNLIYSPIEPPTFKLKSVKKLREEQARQLEEAKRMLMIERPVLAVQGMDAGGGLCWDLPSFHGESRRSCQEIREKSHVVSELSRDCSTHESHIDLIPKFPSPTVEMTTEPSYVSDAQSTCGASAASDASSVSRKRQLSHTMRGHPSSSDLSEISNYDGFSSEFDEFGGLDDDFFGCGSNTNGRNSNGWTKEEAGNLVSFADKWIPTDGKRRKIFSGINV